MCKHRLTLAGLGVDRGLLLRLADSFRKLNASVQTVHLGAGENGNNHDINACLLPLTRAAVLSLEKSPWFQPCRTLIYGVGGALDVARFAGLGINALLDGNNEASIRSAVDATKSILSFGERGRVPIATLVQIDAEGKILTGITKNVGIGGMAVQLFRNASLPHEIKVNLVLPYAGSIRIIASPHWYSGRLVGLRFKPLTEKTRLKSWVKDYSMLGCKRTELLRKTPKLAKAFRA
jgi:hypothetical protein